MKLEIKGDISDIFLTVLIGLACPLLLPLVIKKINSKLKRRKTMAEYIRKEDAVYVINCKCYELKGLAKNITKGVQELPPADVAPVVRCKDCNCHGTCTHEQYLGLDGFCSHGERREE